MKRFLLLFLPFLLFSCNKPEENPELSDPLYLEFKSQKDTATKASADTPKTVEDKKADLEKVKPQTGQIKYAQKRYWEAQSALDTLIQQEKYWAIRIQEREAFDRLEYLKAFKAGKPWPDPKEFEEYSTEKRLREARLQWDAKKRIDDFKKNNPTGPSAPKAGEAPKAPGSEGGE